MANLPHCRSGTAYQQMIQEFMEDHPTTYETRPDRSFPQWLESLPVFDWLLTAYQNARRIAPRSNRSSASTAST